MVSSARREKMSISSLLPFAVVGLLRKCIVSMFHSPPKLSESN